MKHKCNILIILVILTFFRPDGAYAGERGPKLLAPVDGYHTHSGAVWIVVRGALPREFLVDGKAVKPAPGAEADGVYHFRIEGLSPKGSNVTVRRDSWEKTVKVTGSEVSGGKVFHNEAFAPCAECHEYNKNNCRKCHAFKGHKHADYLKCLECHKSPGVVPTATTTLCNACHKEMSEKAHRKLKHPLVASADPKRPGMAFDCVSCHNPHMPRCLDGLNQQEMREWCKSCHSR